ncbi:MAG: riboflavin synthase [Deltaproteobacteria bacterium]|nr:MAG: riboflavin synthase [Deltaproteobacteria bacterium]
MFTGIIEDVGTVRKAIYRGKDLRLTIETSFPLEEVSLGESISVDGVCLTVVGKGEGWFDVEVSGETLSRTTLRNVSQGKRVNLERAMKVGGRLGGHLVYGHVDGTGVLIDAVREGESRRFSFSCASNIMKYVVFKGSIAVNGVSLTVSRLFAGGFEVTVLPYTFENTTFQYLRKGEEVNIEVDVIGKYVEKFLSRDGEDSLVELLKKEGYLSEE